MIKILFYSLFLVTLNLGNLFSQTTNTFFNETDSFLKKYVVNGQVDYKNIYKNSKDLDNLLEKLKTITLPKSPSKIDKTFWINAYNIIVIKGIIDNFPLQSPLDKEGFFDKITHSVAGITITLNHIENKKLRTIYNDARIHFVLVCGAKGCPPLISEAYLPETLEKQLHQQTKIAINNPNFIKIHKNKVELSQIFNWYKNDFITQTKNEIHFLNQYLNIKIPTTLPITYYPYNWKLNSK